MPNFFHGTRSVFGTVNILLSLFLSFLALKQVADDVAKYLDTAPNGVVLFSLGTHTAFMERQQVQVIANGFALLPQRVLWQSTAALPAGVKLANNTKVVRWIPLSQIMGGWRLLSLGSIMLTFRT